MFRLYKDNEIYFEKEALISDYNQKPLAIIIILVIAQKKHWLVATIL